MSVVLLLLAATHLTPAHADEVASWNLDEDDGAFFAANGGLQWAWDTIKGPPLEGATGVSGWSTQPDGHYRNDAAEALVVPTVSLSSTVRPVLELLHWYDIDTTGEGDLGWVEARIDGTWTRIDTVYGYPSGDGFSSTSNGWRTDYFDLSSIAEPAQVRFLFAADTSVTRTGWTIDTVRILDGDPVPPVITPVTTPTDTQDLTGAYTVSAIIVDDVKVDTASLFWVVDGGAVESEEMAFVGEDTFGAAIPGQDPSQTIEWWIEASDGVNLSTWPIVGPGEFRVFLAAPTDVAALDTLPGDRIAADRVTLTWSAPVSPHSLDRYRVFRDGEELAQCETESCEVPLVDGDNALTVAGIFSTDVGFFSGDATEPLTLSATIPAVDTLTPDHGWPGEHLRLTIRGEHLLLQPTDTEIDMEDGVSIASIDVIDVDHVQVRVNIDEDAIPGERTVTLYRSGLPIVVDTPFMVRNDDDRPRIDGIDPRSMRQGAQTTLRIETSEPLDDPPLLDLGTGIYVEAVRVIEGGVEADVSVANDAPLGKHPVEVDAGDRILSGANLEVLDQIKAPRRNCSTGPNSPLPALSWVVLVACVTIRRRQDPSQDTKGREVKPWRTSKAPRPTRT